MFSFIKKYFKKKPEDTYNCIWYRGNGECCYLQEVMWDYADPPIVECVKEECPHKIERTLS